MKTINKFSILFLMLILVLLTISCNQSKQKKETETNNSPNSVETRLGLLTYENGFPTPETTKKLYDEMDFQRAVQAYLWAYPLVSFESIRLSAKKELGLDYMDFAIADDFADPRSVFLTANNTTIYAFTNVDLGKSGPIVIEVPPGAIVGIIDDFWQRSVTDVGLPGPDGDKGGKFLLLPPGYNGELPKNYHILKTTMNNYNIMVRGLVKNLDSDVPNAVQRVKQMKVYPWKDRSNPKANKFVSFTGKKMNTLPPGGLEYWSVLAEAINNNPVEERDRFFMAMIKPLGIEKGKPFQPDARQRAILEEASTLGNAMGRTMLYDGGEERIGGANAFKGTYWNWVVIGDPKQESQYYSQLDERLHYVYGAIYTSPFIGVRKAGPGSVYVQSFKDKEGNRFDGGKSYRLHVPKDVPAANFWSLTIYDTDSRSMLQNTRNNAAHSSYDKLKANTDGSIDLYFGPKAPEGLESNWIETVAGKGFYPMFRFYGPKAGVYDGTWKLPNVELLK